MVFGDKVYCFIKFEFVVGIYVKAFNTMTSLVVFPSGSVVQINNNDINLDFNVILDREVAETTKNYEESLVVGRERYEKKIASLTETRLRLQADEDTKDEAV